MARGIEQARRSCEDNLPGNIWSDLPTSQISNFKDKHTQHFAHNTQFDQQTIYYSSWSIFLLL